ncbi:hypothetical protein RFI_09010 [Reticulomyxa filosa]|uniref:Uncharacterized protein n=1 Tax=Reticulomyxa filosa TaxID=46433 RepID=X6NS05_RETFI|nr:hypothetical protein RFI_09010 [Reticulomyxa filosa]|eukprot:ETO28122.1 hypothetical protein RFI_09010 [Reticulomyxa filosa]
MDVDPQVSPIGFLERYVYSENREELLKELVKGSEDYYYYKLLNENAVIEADAGSLKSKKEIGEAMQKLHKEIRDQSQFNFNSRLKNMMKRNELHFLHVLEKNENGSKEDADLKKSLWEFFRDQFGYSTHSKRVKPVLNVLSAKKEEKKDDKSSIIKSLGIPQKLEANMQYCLSNYSPSLSSYFNVSAIIEYVCTNERFSAIIEASSYEGTNDNSNQNKRRYRQLIGEILNNSYSLYLLSQSSKVDLMKLIAHELAFVSFGDRWAHHQLTLSQMQDLLALRPDLINNNAFLKNYFVKNMPISCQNYYQNNKIDAESMPRDISRTFHDFILTFISKWTKNSCHSTIKGQLLFYLIQFQYNTNVCFLFSQCIVFFFFFFNGTQTLFFFKRKKSD